MRLILPLVLGFLLAVPVWANAEASDTLGKTDAEILAMGLSAWFDLYTGQAGESTLAMSDAYRFYAEAARRRNASLPQQNFAAEFRMVLGDFGERALDIAYNHSGGGTLWHPMYGQMACDVEDVV